MNDGILFAGFVTLGIAIAYVAGTLNKTLELIKFKFDRLPTKDDVEKQIDKSLHKQERHISRAINRAVYKTGDEK